MRIKLRLIGHSKNYDIYQETDGLHQKWYLPACATPAEFKMFEVSDLPYLKVAQ